MPSRGSELGKVRNLLALQWRAEGDGHLLFPRARGLDDRKRPG